jgi:uncharacterized membrane protein
MKIVTVLAITFAAADPKTVTGTWNATPLANVMLSVLHALGLSDLERFGDSDGAFDLSPAEQ